MKKLLLADGNSMLFRGYYATAYGMRMTAPDGTPTNAVFAFANMLQKAIDLISPDSILVAFDAGKHTFRHDIYPDYKGGRKPAPDDLVPQFKLVRDYLDAFNIRWAEMPDIEADDLIGTMSDNQEGYESIILTSDHDLLQLIDEDTTVLLMKKGITDMDEMTVSSLKDEMGISPIQITDLKGLMGDSSDNYPGIPGVGEKTALKLLYEYGSVENVLDHAAEIKGKLGEKIRDNKESALLSKRLATIKKDVSLNFSAESCAFHPDYISLTEFLLSLGMRTIAAKYREKAEEQRVCPSEAICTEGIKDSENEEPMRAEGPFCPGELLEGDCSVFVSCSSEPFEYSEFKGIAVSNGKLSAFVKAEDLLSDTELISYLCSSAHRKTGFDIKKSMHILKAQGIEAYFEDDALLAAFIADSGLSSPDNVFRNFGLEAPSFESIYGTSARPRIADEGEEREYSCLMAENIGKLFAKAVDKLREKNMLELYRNVELPLTFILCGMEEEGIRCKEDVLSEIAETLKEQISVLEKEIYSIAGHEFNINSPKQLASVLYDEMGLPSGKKQSTAADVLEKLKFISPIAELILSYRKASKILGTYAEGLKKFIMPDGKIHTVFNQCVTATGRLSSSDPNLQNISVRDEQGRLIRKAFFPSDGNVLLSSDYHQIELRMLAHMAGEKAMINAFKNDIDIHTQTACDVFGIKAEDVTKEMRRRAKTVNFGIVYGISDFGLSEQLGISRREAHSFIESYYQSYPGIKSYMDSVVASCEEKGYVSTLCGRRREIPEIKDKNRNVREFGKRAAMNAPIQGSAADLIKIAMINISGKLREGGYRSKMILQVHDELIFDVPGDELEAVKKIVTDEMTSAMKLDVPLTVECSAGNNWFEAK
ncbi:MAG: DNA polymerase I [Oscillospiraceae bacterium]|nr:DNA polymerase I [Oscillospiraceae bacterium]